MKHVILYATMVLFTFLTLLLKQPWTKVILLLVIWGDYILLTWYLMQKDAEV
jgi:hypothetical protein